MCVPVWTYIVDPGLNCTETQRVFGVGSGHSRVDSKIAEHSVSTGDLPLIKHALRSALCLEREVTKIFNNMLAKNAVQE